MKELDILKRKLVTNSEQYLNEIQVLQEQIHKVECDLRIIEGRPEYIDKELLSSKTKSVSEIRHSTELKYTKDLLCKHCGSTFNSMKLLKDHMKTQHISDKKCRYCELTFKSSIEMEVHMSEIHKSNALECNKCKSKFYSKW